MPKSKFNKISNEKSGIGDEDKELNLLDVTCPICLSIMIRPVTMPCDHSLCLTCFDLNVSESNLACPLCRKRISIWVRRMTKLKKLINEKLWQKIQANFMCEIEARMNGVDDLDNSFASTFPPRKVSAPGEIREEYETQLKKLVEEEESIRKREETASKAAILALQQEEEKQLNNLAHEREAISEQDLEFAKKLRTSQMNETLNNIKNKKSHRTPQPKTSSTSTLTSPTRGPLDFFLEQVTPKSNKKILHQVTPPPTSNENVRSIQQIIKKGGSKSHVSEFQVNNIQRTFSTEIRIPSAGASVFTSYPSSPVSATSSRVFKDITYQYSSESETEFDSEENIFNADKTKNKKLLKSKRNDKEGYVYEDDDDLKNHPERDASKDKEGSIHAKTSAEDESQWTFLAEEIDENDPAYKEKYLKLLEEQKVVEERLRQEKEDRRFALQLQKSLKEVNRAKGSEDEYSLRKKIGPSSPRPEKVGPLTPRQKKNSKDCSLSSSHNLAIGTPKRKQLRQPTLVESLAKRQRRV